MAVKYLLLVLAGLLIGSATSEHQRNGPFPPEHRDPIQTDGGNYMAASSRHTVASEKSGRSSLGKLICNRSPSAFVLSDGDSVIFRSPRYPYYHPPRVNCGWLLEGATPDTYFTVACSFFRLESRRGGNCPDFLSLNGRRFCGRIHQSPRGRMSSCNTLNIWFRSDSSKNYRGFDCRATAHVPVPPVTQALQSRCGARCGIPNRPPRIVGGVATEINEYPWQVAIAYFGSDDLQDFFCGGSIINKRWVLSAAHCEISAYYHQVIVGAHEWGNNPASHARVNIETVIDHESFNRATYDNDIALVKVWQDFDFSAVGVGPVCLPSLGSVETYAGQKATVSGWGKIQDKSNLYACKLQEAEVDVVTNFACTADYGHGTITANMICAGIDAGGKDSCEGDSGGPLSVKESGVFTQIGVVSFGDICGSADYYGVYARVTRFMQWIDRNVGEDGFCSRVETRDISYLLSLIDLSIR